MNRPGGSRPAIELHPTDDRYGIGRYVLPAAYSDQYKLFSRLDVCWTTDVSTVVSAIVTGISGDGRLIVAIEE